MTSGSSKKPPNRHYEVGYGKPPVSGRFTKGVSGNPRGRPKKDQPVKCTGDTSVRDRFLEEARRTITVLEAGAPVEMSAFNAVLRAEMFAALKGNTHAQRNILERAERYGNERAAEVEESHKFWRSYIERVNTHGLKVPEGCPHPDDIVFQEGELVWFRGGDPEEAKKNREMVCRFRDALILQEEKEVRHFKRQGWSEKAMPVTLAAVLVEACNRWLPKRLQWNDTEMLMRMLRVGTLNARDLDRSLRKAWAGLGVPKAKDLVTPIIDKSFIAKIKNAKRDDETSASKRVRR